MRYTWARVRRKPLIYATILLFAAVIALVLCGLRGRNDEALARYEEIYDTINVRCTVTDLTGSQSDRLYIWPGTVKKFTQPGDMSDLLEDVQIKGSVETVWNDEVYTLTGITSTDIAPRLWPDNGCTIFWNEGADSGIFGGSGMECIIPQELQKKLLEEDLPGDVFPLRISGDFSHREDYEGELEVLGVYQGGNDKIIYCPWDTYAAIMEPFGSGGRAESLYATLRDNSDLPLFREIAARYFAQPDPRNGGMEAVGDHYLALDIDDSRLLQAKRDLENSMTVNRVAAALVLVLSAVAGAFVGFLMIRTRQREIALMRAMGTPDRRIYFGFVIEQMTFVILGTILGGSMLMWNPASWLILFILTYFVGLSAALLIMLRKNLLTIIKEDE